MPKYDITQTHTILVNKEHNLINQLLLYKCYYIIYYVKRVMNLFTSKIKCYEFKCK